MKLIASHRKARRDYDILETYEAGIELKGMEVKSLRTRGCSIDESFARMDEGEVFIFNMHIPEFSQASYFQPDPRRRRKLLLRKMMSRYVPSVITDQEKKGFSAPDASWFRGESIDYVQKILYNKHSRIYRFLERNAVQRLVNEHLEGKQNRRLFIWSLLNFEWWLRTFMDN